MRIEQLTIIFDEKDANEHRQLQAELRKQGLKYCKRCKTVLPLHRFRSKSGKRRTKVDSRCKPCTEKHRRDSKLGKPYTRRELAGNIYARTKQNAKTAGVPFSLTTDGIHQRLLESGYRCELTGIEFKIPIHKAKQGWSRRTPSVHRIVPERGYTMENVSFILNQLNTAIGNGTEEEFGEMAVAYVRRNGL